MGVPPWQAPLWQESFAVHALPSSQAVPLTTAACVTPPTGSQASAVQALPSSKEGAAEVMQVPLWHDSWPLQTVPSSQAVPSGAVGFEHAPVAASQLPAT